MHLIVPMSGQGSRFVAAGYRAPKPLIDLDGEPMIARVLQQYPSAWPVHLVTGAHHADTELPKALSALRPDAHRYEVPEHKEGPARAIEAALPAIPADAPVLVSYCDFGLVWDAHAFERMVQDSGCDAALVTYRGYQPHYASQTPYAYARLQGECVREVREKGHFTSVREHEHASAGAYYFRTRRLLQEALAYQRQHDLRAKGELYTSLTVQALLARDPHAYVRVFEATSFFQWGTPADVEAYLYWRRTHRHALRTQRAQAQGAASGYQIEQLVMPMAGGGTRFRARSPVAKPLLPIDGQPMFVAATSSLPVASQKRIYVARANEVAAVQAASAQAPGAAAHVVSLASTPPGQALSTRAALTSLQPDAPVLVSACDHGIVLAPESWRAFREDPDCDAAIFTMAGYPGAARSPHSFAYVEPRADAGSERFARIARVSVKVPLSERPSADAVLVGTFWFRSAAILQEAIEAVVEADRRVNGELYLDTGLAMLLERGRVLRMVPLQGYINWGAPDAYDEALYYRQALCGLSPTAPMGALPQPIGASDPIAQVA